MRLVRILRLLTAAFAFHGLSPAIAQSVLEEIHVTGVPINQSPGELAQSVTVLRDETLDRIRAGNLGETLAGQLGISSSFFGAGSSRPIIRGLAGPRVRTMEDGIDSMDLSGLSIDHAVSIDPLVAQQIEVFRGPTTLLYGSGAVGGVINTVTNRIPETASADGLDAAIELRGDSVSDGQSAGIAVDGGGANVAWHLDAASRSADDYEIPGFADVDAIALQSASESAGIVPNSDLETESLAAGISWLGDNSLFGVAVSSFAANYGLPGHHEEEIAAAVQSNSDSEFARIDLEQTRVDLKGEWFGVSEGIQVINFRAGVNDYAHVELEGGAIGTRFDNEAFEARIEVLHSPWGQWQGAIGVQFGRRKFSAIGEEAFVPPVDTGSVGLFMIEQRDTDYWNFSVGGRVERQEQRPSNGLVAVDDYASSFSFAAVREFGQAYSLTLNIARAQRMPTAEELYSNGPHLASSSVEIGTPTLQAEVSRHFDLGIRKTNEDLTWSITAFLTDYDSFIFLRDTGSVDALAALPIFEFSQRDAKLTGLEAELFTPIAKFGAGELDLRIFGDFVAGRFSGGGYIPRMPPGRLGSRLQFHNQRMIAGIELTRYDDQTRLAAFESPTSAYSMLNADLNWTLSFQRGRSIDLFVLASNLLDEDARRHTSLVKDSTPLPGRNFAMGVRASL